MTYVGVVAADHLAVGHLVAETVRWLVGIDWHVKYVIGVRQRQQRRKLWLNQFFLTATKTVIALVLVSTATQTET